MTTDFLRSLLQLCGDHQGVVPRTSRPVSNRWPRFIPPSCVALAEAALRDGDFSMQRFVRRA